MENPVPTTDGDPVEADDRAEFDNFLLWQEKVRGTNISEVTLLATDYLNHFNEIIMLLGMVADMPDLIDECRGWQPKGYQDHFRDSSFSDRETAIAAYEHVPKRFRKAFEETIAQMNEVVAAVIGQVDHALAEGQADLVAVKVQTGVQLLQRLLDFASAIIHGSESTMNQAQIDMLVGKS